MKTALISFALLLVACGGPAEAEQEESVGNDVVDTELDTTDDDTAAEPSGSDCYVIRVGEQEGCWADADEACSEVCGAPCMCTEATVNNTCGC